MDNKNISSSKFCGSCGKELKNATQFCPYRGQKIDVSKPVTTYPNRKGLIITSVSLVLVLLIVISGVSFATNNKTDNSLSIKKKTTAQDYLNETLLSEYQLNEDNIILKYKYVESSAYIDCSKFKDSILDYKITDFNNDGVNDIYVLTLKRDTYEDLEDNYSKLTLESTVFLADGNGNFDECSPAVFELYEDFNSHSTLNDYYSTDYNFALHQASDSAWYILASTIVTDDQRLYEKDETYYSIEDSYGRYSEAIDVYRISNMGILDTLYVNRDIDHLLGIPEAENYNYYMARNDNGNDTLISGGVHRIIAGDDYPTPIESEASGTCSSESEACEMINNELDKYELQDYHLEPFKWEERFEKGFTLDKNATDPVCFKIHSISTDEASGEFMIELK